MSTLTYSEPPTRIASPVINATLERAAGRTATPPPPASRPIPTDFKTSLAAWWATSGYRDARIAEDRLLRRLSYYQPAPVQPTKSWLPWTSAAADAGVEAAVMTPAPSDKGLVATLRNVFITTPDPLLAPARPDDVAIEDGTPSPNASSSSLNSNHKKHSHHKKATKGLDYLNTLEISNPEFANSKEAVVVLHGYAAALGFFFRNWDSVAQSGAATGRRTFFLDWLGMGLSSRPSPALLNSPAGSPVEQRVARAEHFFLSSLESWRASVGIERMVLVGHSLGGYLASAYAVRYPHRVSSLILVSPAGIPHGPDDAPPVTSRPTTGPGGKAWENGKPVQGESTAVDAAPAPQHTSLDEAADAAEQEFDAGPKGEAKQWQKNREASAFRRGATKMFIWGWEKGLSPFSILRGIGPWGPMLVGRYSSRRFAAQTPEDVRDLHSYIYGTSVLKGSGEFCISHILAPGAYARIPIVDRIHKLKIPVTFLYGDNDWMDVEGGYESKRVLAKAGNPNASVHVVPGAGHHLYLDNPKFSNRIMDEAIRAAPKL